MVYWGHNEGVKRGCTTSQKGFTDMISRFKRGCTGIKRECMVPGSQRGCSGTLALELSSLFFLSLRRSELKLQQYFPLLCSRLIESTLPLDRYEIEEVDISLYTFCIKFSIYQAIIMPIRQKDDLSQYISNEAKASTRVKDPSIHEDAAAKIFIQTILRRSSNHR